MLKPLLAQKFINSSHTLMMRFCPTPDSLIDTLDPNVDDSDARTVPGIEPR